MRKIIHKTTFTDAFPNLELKDFWLCTLSLFDFRKWDKANISEFELNFSKKTGLKNVLTLDSARSALYFLLNNFNLEKNSEVLLASFTCMVVPNSVYWAGLNIRYIDISTNDFNPTIDQILASISSNTKAILVQHTFGKKINTKLLKEKLKEKKLSQIFIIEDFAHTITPNMTVDGDFGIFTFGIEKVISTVRGGALVVNDSDLFSNLKSKADLLPDFPVLKSIVFLLNPIFWYLVLPLHNFRIKNFSLGAVIREVWRKLGFLGISIEKKEYSAIKPTWLPCKISPVLANFGSYQLSKLERINKHRSKIASIYFKYLSKFSDDTTFDPSRVYIRFPVLILDKNKFKKTNSLLRKNGITSGNWYTKPLYGLYITDEAYVKLGYKFGENIGTESKTGKIINLPTSLNIDGKRADFIASELKNILNDSD